MTLAVGVALQAVRRGATGRAEGSLRRAGGAPSSRAFCGDAFGAGGAGRCSGGEERARTSRSWPAAATNERKRCPPFQPRPPYRGPAGAGAVLPAHNGRGCLDGVAGMVARARAPHDRAESTTKPAFTSLRGTCVSAANAFRLARPVTRCAGARRAAQRAPNPSSGVRKGPSAPCWKRQCPPFHGRALLRSRAV
jgi:hypothetical protein